MKIPIEISARHIHLCQEHLEELFGPGCQLKKLRDLSLPHLFAAQETLTIRSEENEIKKVRVVGPLREKTQLELSLTDAHNLKIDIPLRLSGELEASAGITLIGPKGRVELERGVIAAKRHIHFGPEKAQELGLKHKDLVSVRLEGERGLVFHEVVVRVSQDFKEIMHLDTDEGNASGIIKKAEGEIIL